MKASLLSNYSCVQNLVNKLNSHEKCNSLAIMHQFVVWYNDINSLISGYNICSMRMCQHHYFVYYTLCLSE